jgi:cell division protein FtsN
MVEMFQDRDGEKEILLGNKQLLGIFFVLVILFVVLFGAGYMVGRTSGEKKATDTAVEAKSAPAESAVANSGDSRAVNPDPTTALTDADSERTKTISPASEGTPAVKRSPAASSAPAPLGSRKAANTESAGLTRSEIEQKAEAEESPAAGSAGHRTYLQVAALQRPEAEKVAKILSKKGFRTRIAPKPGTQYYRVLVGPVRDAGDLASTRDALRTKGFREVFVQRL